MGSCRGHRRQLPLASEDTLFDDIPTLLRAEPNGTANSRQALRRHPIRLAVVGPGQIGTA